MIYHEHLDLWIHEGVDGFHDLAVVNELQESLLYHVPNKNQLKTVIDVGAHIGAFSRLLHKHCPQAKFACVEPDQSNFDCLKRNVKGFGLALRAAVSYSGDNSVPFYPRASTDNTGAGSLFRDEFLFNKDLRGEPVNVATTTLDEIMTMLEWDGVNLLKLDCEGAEFEILEQADLSRVERIVGEYHDRERFMRLRHERFLRNWRLDTFTGNDPRLGLFLLTRRYPLPPLAPKLIGG